MSSQHWCGQENTAWKVRVHLNTSVCSCGHLLWFSWAADLLLCQVWPSHSSLEMPLPVTTASHLPARCWWFLLWALQAPPPPYFIFLINFNHRQPFPPGCEQLHVEWAAGDDVESLCCLVTDKSCTKDHLPRRTLIGSCSATRSHTDGVLETKAHTHTHRHTEQLLLSFYWMSETSTEMRPRRNKSSCLQTNIQMFFPLCTFGEICSEKWGPAHTPHPRPPHKNKSTVKSNPRRSSSHLKHTWNSLLLSGNVWRALLFY